MNIWEKLLYSLLSFLSGLVGLVSVPTCSCRAPEITLQPISQVANPGSRVELTVKSDLGKRYAWFKNEEILADKREETLVFEAIEKADEGFYYCQISNGRGEIKSQTAEIKVNDPPQIISNFSAVTIKEGEELLLRTEISGTEPFSFSYFLNNKLQGTSTDCFWRIEKAQVSDSGQWSFLVTNVTGIPLRSTPVEIVVLPLNPVSQQIEGELEIDFPLCQSDFCATANVDDDPSSPLEMTFCEAFESVRLNAPINLLDGYAPIANYFTNQGDLNGYFWVDRRQGDDLITFQFDGNFIPDCAFELGLLERILNDPQFCLCSTGISHKQVHDAWKANFAQMKQDLGSRLELAELLMPGFQQILCGYATIGDGQIDYSIEKYLSGYGSFGLFLGIAYLSGSKVPNRYPDPSTYVLFSELLSSMGDADGDGFTNAEEYFAFGANSSSYLEAALNPDIVP